MVVCENSECLQAIDEKNKEIDLWKETASNYSLLLKEQQKKYDIVNRQANNLQNIIRTYAENVDSTLRYKQMKDSLRLRKEFKHIESIASRMYGVENEIRMIALENKENCNNCHQQYQTLQEQYKRLNDSYINAEFKVQQYEHKVQSLEKQISQYLDFKKPRKVYEYSSPYSSVLTPESSICGSIEDTASALSLDDAQSVKEDILKDIKDLKYVTQIGSVTNPEKVEKQQTFVNNSKNYLNTKSILDFEGDDVVSETIDESFETDIIEEEVKNQMEGNFVLKDNAKQTVSEKLKIKRDQESKKKFKSEDCTVNMKLTVHDEKPLTAYPKKYLNSKSIFDFEEVGVMSESSNEAFDADSIEEEVEHKMDSNFVLKDDVKQNVSGKFKPNKGQESKKKFESEDCMVNEKLTVQDGNKQLSANPTNLNSKSIFDPEEVGDTTKSSDKPFETDIEELVKNKLDGNLVMKDDAKQNSSEKCKLNSDQESKKKVKSDDCIVNEQLTQDDKKILSANPTNDFNSKSSFNLMSKTFDKPLESDIFEVQVKNNMASSFITEDSAKQNVSEKCKLNSDQQSKKKVKSEDCIVNGQLTQDDNKQLSANPTNDFNSKPSFDLMSKTSDKALESDIIEKQVKNNMARTFITEDSAKQNVSEKCKLNRNQESKRKLKSEDCIVNIKLTQDDNKKLPDSLEKSLTDIFTKKNEENDITRSDEKKSCIKRDLENQQFLEIDDIESNMTGCSSSISIDSNDAESILKHFKLENLVSPLVSDDELSQCGDLETFGTKQVVECIFDCLSEKSSFDELKRNNEFTKTSDHVLPKTENNVLLQSPSFNLKSMSINTSSSNFETHRSEVTNVNEDQGTFKKSDLNLVKCLSTQSNSRDNLIHPQTNHSHLNLPAQTIQSHQNPAEDSRIFGKEKQRQNEEKLSGEKHNLLIEKITTDVCEEFEHQSKPLSSVEKSINLVPNHTYSRKARTKSLSEEIKKFDRVDDKPFLREHKELEDNNQSIDNSKQPSTIESSALSSVEKPLVCQSEIKCTNKRKKKSTSQVADTPAKKKHKTPSPPPKNKCLSSPQSDSPRSPTSLERYNLRTNISKPIYNVDQILSLNFEPFDSDNEADTGKVTKKDRKLFLLNNRKTPIHKEISVPLDQPLNIEIPEALNSSNLLNPIKSKKREVSKLKEVKPKVLRKKKAILMNDDNAVESNVLMMNPIKEHTEDSGNKDIPFSLTPPHEEEDLSFQTLQKFNARKTYEKHSNIKKKTSASKKERCVVNLAQTVTNLLTDKIELDQDNRINSEKPLIIQATEEILYSSKNLPSVNDIFIQCPFFNEKPHVPISDIISSLEISERVSAELRIESYDSDLVNRAINKRKIDPIMERQPENGKNEIPLKTLRLENGLSEGSLQEIGDLNQEHSTSPQPTCEESELSEDENCLVLDLDEDERNDIDRIIVPLPNSIDHLKFSNLEKRVLKIPDSPNNKDGTSIADPEHTYIEPLWKCRPESLYVETPTATNVDFSSPQSTIMPFPVSPVSCKSYESARSNESKKFDEDPTSARNPEEESESKRTAQFLPKFYTEQSIEEDSNRLIPKEVVLKKESIFKFPSNSKQIPKTIKDYCTSGEKMDVEGGILWTAINSHKNSCTNYMLKNRSQKRILPSVAGDATERATQLLYSFVCKDLKTMEEIVQFAKQLSGFDCDVIIKGFFSALINLGKTMLSKNGEGNPHDDKRLWMKQLMMSFPKQNSKYIHTHHRIKEIVVLLKCLKEEMKTFANDRCFLEKILRSIEVNTLMEGNSGVDDCILMALSVMMNVYTVLAKEMRARYRVRRFLVDIIYCLNKAAYIVALTILNNWSEILPVQPFEKYLDQPIALSIIFALTTSASSSIVAPIPINEHIKKVITHLKWKYNVQPDTMDPNQLANMFFSQLTRPGVQEATILLAKRGGVEWFKNKHFKKLVDTVHRWQKNEESDSTAAAAINLIGCVGRTFQGFNVNQVLQSALQVFKEALTSDTVSDSMKEVVALNLCRLSLVCWESVLDVLMVWKPKRVASEVIDKVLTDILKRQKTLWWKHHSYLLAK